MKIGSYLFGIVIALAGLVGAMYVSGNSPLIYTDFMSLLIILILALPLLIATYGWKAYWNCWRLAFSAEVAGREDYHRAADVIRSTRRLTYLAAGLATFLGVIGTLMHIQGDPGMVSQTVNYAISLIAFFYALVIDLVLITPVRSYLIRESAGVDPE